MLAWRVHEDLEKSDRNWRRIFWINNTVIPTSDFLVRFSPPCQNPNRSWSILKYSLEQFKPDHSWISALLCMLYLQTTLTELFPTWDVDKNKQTRKQNQTKPKNKNIFLDSWRTRLCDLNVFKPPINIQYFILNQENGKCGEFHSSNFTAMVSSYSSQYIFLNGFF